MRIAVAIAGALALTAAAPSALAGTDVKLDQLPKEVQKTVEDETKDGKIKDIERDTEQGRTIYEVEFTTGGEDFELDIAEDGTLLERRLD